MKPIGRYNKLPKTFKQPEKLAKGQVVRYRLVEDYRTEVITSREGTKITRWPENIKIPCVDTIQITYKDESGEEKSDLFDIGLVRQVDRDGNPSLLDTIWIPANALGGEFAAVGGSIEDEKRYWLFELCNRNASNPNRDQAVQPMFYRVDVIGEAEKENKKVEVELECLLYIRNLSPKQLKELAASFVLNENEPEPVLRKKLNDIAKADPAKFYRDATSKEVEVKAMIQRAFTKGVIKYVPQQHKVTWGGKENGTISTLPRVEGQTWQDLFSDWIKTSGKNGTATYENIRKMMSEDPS